MSTKQKVGLFKRAWRFIPSIIYGARKVHDAMTAEQRAATLHYLRNPGEWRGAIETAWDTTKVNALEVGGSLKILARIAAGRKVSRSDRKAAADGLGLIGTVVPPLRVFMVPGSHMLLGVAAFVLPWKLIPDKWIPIKSLRSEEPIFEGMPLGEDGLPEMPQEKKRRLRLFRRSQRKAIEMLED